jgi:hypothetical protein
LYEKCARILVYLAETMEKRQPKIAYERVNYKLAFKNRVISIILHISTNILHTFHAKHVNLIYFVQLFQHPLEFLSI